ncbi:hypothetical protein IPG41_06550 [Candidatus Peregrinibacteria bacterium]|nr:MAG: hypothetical protein IPG41_06550 [Candidatus Peregrinibacteria bacterium]
MNKRKIVQVSIMTILIVVGWATLINIYYIYKDIFIKHDGPSNYDLMEPFITYFNQGQYQVVPDVFEPFDYSLIRIDNPEEANDNTGLIGNITKYILVENHLYVAGQTSSSKEEEAAESYMIINMTTGEINSFSLIKDLSKEDRKIFEMKLGNTCLVDRTCYEKGVNPTLWNIFN